MNEEQIKAKALEMIAAGDRAGRDKSEVDAEIRAFVLAARAKRDEEPTEPPAIANAYADHSWWRENEEVFGGRDGYVKNEEGFWSDSQGRELEGQRSVMPGFGAAPSPDADVLSKLRKEEADVSAVAQEPGYRESSTESDSTLDQALEGTSVTEEQEADNELIARKDYNNRSQTAQAVAEFDSGFGSITRDEEEQKEKELRDAYAEEGRLAYVAKYGNEYDGGRGGWAYKKEKYIDERIKKDDIDSYSEVIARNDAYNNAPEFQQAKINTAKVKFAKENGYTHAQQLELNNTVINVNDPDSWPEGFEDTYNNVQVDDPDLREAVIGNASRAGDAESVQKNVAEFVENLPSDWGTSEYAHARGGGIRAGNLFSKKDAQIAIELAADGRLELLKENDAVLAKKLRVTAIALESNSKALDSAMKELNDLGDVEAKIKAIAEGSYTTQDQVDKAKSEIQALVSQYKEKSSEANKYANNHKALVTAYGTLDDEFETLQLEEDELSVFTDYIGDNHQLGAQMAWSLASGAIEVGQGLADAVYMINPLGALADSVISSLEEKGYDNLDTIKSAVDLARFTTGPVSWYSGDTRQSIKASVDGWQANVASNIQAPMAYGDIDSFSDLAEYAGVMIAGQIPNLALMYATGGLSLYMMGASSAGASYSAMEDKRNAFEESGGLYGQDYSFAQMLTISTLKGTAEALSEKVTLGQLKKTGFNLSKSSLRTGGVQGYAKYLRQNVFDGQAIRNNLLDITEEGGSEVLATLAGNSLDIMSGSKDVGLFDDIAESFVSGAMISSTIKSPVLFKHAIAPFQSNNGRQVLNENFARINQIEDLIASGGLSVDARVELETEVAELVQQNKKAIELDVQRVDALEDKDKSALLEIERANNGLSRKYNALSSKDSGLTEEQREREIQKLETKFAQNNAKKQGILQKYPSEENTKKYKQSVEVLRNRAKEVEKAGGKKVNVIEGNSKAFVEEVARISTPEIREKLEGIVQDPNASAGDKAAAQQALDQGAEYSVALNKAKREGVGENYGLMTPNFNENGELDSYTIFINKESSLKDGMITTGAHEFMHVALYNTVKQDPEVRAALGTKVDEILGIQDDGSYAGGKGVNITKKGSAILKARLKEYKKGEQGEETLAIVSELMANGDITIDDSAIGRLKDFFRRIFQLKINRDIKFDTSNDVRNFMKDFHRSLNKGKKDARISRLTAEGTSGGLIQEAQEKRDAGAAEAVEERQQAQFSRAVDSNMRANPDMKSEIDTFVQDEAGNRKFENNEEFKVAPEYYEAYLHLVEGRTLDGLIQQGMTDLGLPPDALRDFTVKVKNNIGERFLKNYDVAKNDSLFGWLTGVSGGAGRSIVYRAKGDVMNKYKEDNQLATVSIDASMDSGGGDSFAAQIEAEVDESTTSFEEQDLSVGSRNSPRVRRRKRQGVKAAESLNMSPKVISGIETVVNDAKVNLEGLTYKGVKKLTSTPGSSLSGVLDAVATEFGIEAKRIVKPADLNGAQRKAAQEYIKKNSKALLELLPEGETRSGQATGVAKSKLSELYEKGGRVKAAEGAGTQGKFSQTKRTDVTAEEFNALFGIKPDGTLDGNKKFDGAIKAMVNQTAVIVANQAIRENALENGTFAEATVALLGDGRSEVMFSKKVADKNQDQFAEQFDSLAKRVAASNPADLKSVEIAVASVLTDELGFSNRERKAIAKNIWEQTKDYNRIVSAHKAGAKVVGVPKSLDEFLNDNFVQESLDPGIIGALRDVLPKNSKGKTIPIGAHFLEADRVQRNRAAVVGIGNKMVEEGSSLQEAAETMIAYFSGMYSRAAKMADGRFVVDDNVVIDNPAWDQLVKDSINESGKPPKNRKQIFSNQADFINTLRSIPGLESLRKSGKGYSLNGVKLDTTLLGESSEAFLKDQDFDARKAQADKARKAVKTALDFYWERINSKEGGYDYADFAMIVTSMGSGMQAPIRRAAPAEYIAEGTEQLIADAAKKGKSIGKVTEYEHMVPQEEVAIKILHSYLNEGELNNNVWDNYKVAVIPKSMDRVVVEAGYQRRSPADGGSRYYNMKTFRDPRLKALRSIDPAKKGTPAEFVGKNFVEAAKALDSKTDVKASDIQALNEAYRGISFSKKPKGASVWDFDDTLARTKSDVLFTSPDGIKGKLSAEEFATQGSELLADGYEFDFSEFNKVTEGKPGPLLNKALERAKKFGTKDQFILTARAPQAQQAIYEFLKGVGLNIPMENIKGLGNSTGQAKASWIAENLIANGYNDLYFADDALQNIDAVKDMFNRFDVKGAVRLAKVQFSKKAPAIMDGIIDEGAVDLNKEFNITLEQTKGVKAEKTFSPAKARQRGKDKGKYKFFIPPSADDFAGLMYSFLGKGKQGEKHHAWFKEHLFDPYSKAIRHLNAVQTIVAGDMRALKKAMPGVKNLLKKTIPGTEYTNEHAVRVYNWVKAGLTVPGLSQADTDTLVKKVENNADLKQFAETVSNIAQMPGGLQQAGNDWLAGTITTDLKDALDTARAVYLDQWKNNASVIFNEANMNKIEAVYGSNFREALEDSLFRMETGSNRSKGQGRLLNNFMNWINGSIGATMFFNSRSAVLQTLSTVNFINWSDNNPLKAAAAFGNQKQYWSDMVMIFNSDFLKQRRSGLTQDVNTAELAEAIRGATNPARAAMGYLLQIGFTPTQVADSFAIASGGATFYRNRIKSLQEKGMNKAEAENQAFLDFMEIAEETQQSARPDRISQQQASPLGKLILAFQNTPMQYNRLIKKAAQDLVNGRGDAKTHISKILYYGAIQNAIFYSLQNAMFAMLFDDDEEDDEDKNAKKKERVVNGMVDGILRGAGIGGAVVSTLKNVIIRFAQEQEKDNDGVFFTQPDHAYTLLEALNLSPPIGIKARKLYSAAQTWEFNNEVIDHMSKTDIDNPAYDAIFTATEALTNLPLSRAYNKFSNIKEALNSENEMWKRIALALGWSSWSLGIQNQSLTDAKGEVKDLRDAATEKRREERKIEREKEKEQEDQKVEDENLEIQEEEREQGKEEILCAAVNKAGKRCGTKVVEGKNFCTIHEEAEQRTDGVKTQCSHTKSDGKRCKMQTSNKSGLCYYHD
jgi:hypothetical protein